MPGAPALASELGVDPKTVGLAFHLLEKEGVLVPQGAGRPRRIELPNDEPKSQLRVAILLYEDFDRKLGYMVDLQHSLIQAGYLVSYAPKTMFELGVSLKRIQQQVTSNEVDAWIVCGGPLDVLKWFSIQSVPSFALFGRRRSFDIAGIGPDNASAIRSAIQHLTMLDHQRIVMLSRDSSLKSVHGPSYVHRAALEEMEKCGIHTSPYNLPEWSSSPESLREILNSLFKVSPPTALIIDEAFIFHAVKEHLAQRGILAPKQVSLVCINGDATFKWCKPSVAHIQWDSRPWINRVLSWMNNVKRGKKDLRQSLTKSVFVDGETVGAVPRS